MKIIFLLTLFSISTIACEQSLQRITAFAIEERGNGNFKVRISAFSERRQFGGALAGVEYVFESKSKNEREWKEFMSYQYDDRIPIDKNSIVFVDDKTAFVFMINKLAVTTTEGMTWSVWDLSKVQSLRDDLSCKIQNAKIQQDGMGTMNIKCNKLESTLSTKDFGTTWNE